MKNKIYRYWDYHIIYLIYLIYASFFVAGLGCLIFVLPQALVGRYEPLLNSNGFGNGGLCQLSVNGTSEFCFSNYGGRWYYIFIFFLAQLLMGGGTTPLYTLGPAYIDENVHPKSSPIYLAVFFASSLLGPGLGFISGGSLLKIYVDVTQVTRFVGIFEQRISRKRIYNIRV